MSCLQCNWSVEAASASGDMSPRFLKNVQQSHADRNEQHVIEIVCVSILLSRASCVGLFRLNHWNGTGTGSNLIDVEMMKISEPQGQGREYYLGYININDL